MSETIEFVSLADVCEINPKGAVGLPWDTEVTFVPMAAVDEKTGTIQSAELRRYGDVAKGYTVFRDRDVLFAKITPCMENGKIAIANNLQNGWGFGSTEFHILRTSSQIIPEWIYYFLRQEKVRHFAALNMTGTAGQQRVPKSIFEKLIIPLPPISAQQQITAILEKADAVREKRRRANQLTEQFLQSAFLEMFGDPATNPKGWKKSEFGEVVSDTRLGLVRGSSEQNEQYEYSYVKMNSITRNGYLDLSSVTRVNATSAEVEEHSLLKKDFLFNTRNSRELVGKTALFLGDGVYLFNNNILRVRFTDSISAEFIAQLFQTSWIQQELEKRKSGTTNVFAIYYKDLRSLPIILPPLSEQQEFAALVEKVESLRAKQRQSEQELEHLFHSLMQRAFRGELVKE